MDLRKGLKINASIKVPSNLNNLNLRRFFNTYNKELALKIILIIMHVKVVKETGNFLFSFWKIHCENENFGPLLLP